MGNPAGATFGAAHAVARLGGGPGEHAAAPTLRLSPDLLADLEGRVGPQTAARMKDAAGAGRAFAQRLGLEGQEAQSVADVLTQLVFDVAQGERDGAAGSEQRAAAVQRAAQNAIDGLRWLIPASALAEGEREITRWTGDVRVTFAHPSAAEWERARAMLRRSPEIGPLP